MPYLNLETHPLLANNTDFDIWDETNSTLDLQKLQNYFEPVLIYRDRSADKDLRIIKPMKKCSREDFTKRGFKLDRMLISQLNTLICPDFDDNYILQN